MLLITANDWSKAHEGAWVRAIEQIGVFVPVWPLKREELPAWIGARMASRGVAASPDAIAWLADRVEGNLLAAAQEIDKLALLDDGRPLDVAALEASVADDARYDVFRLDRCRDRRRRGRALRIVAGLRAEGEDLIPLLGWVLNQLRMLLRLADAGSNLASAFRSERIWPARENLFRRALKKRERRALGALPRAGRAHRLHRQGPAARRRRQIMGRRMARARTPDRRDREAARRGGTDRMKSRTPARRAYAYRAWRPMTLDDADRSRFSAARSIRCTTRTCASRGKRRSCSTPKCA